MVNVTRHLIFHDPVVTLPRPNFANIRALFRLLITPSAICKTAIKHLSGFMAVFRSCARHHRLTEADSAARTVGTRCHGLSVYPV